MIKHATPDLPSLEPRSCTRTCFRAELGGHDPLWEARARIERLEAALRSVIASEAHYDLEPRGYIVPDQVMQWARAALAGKEG